MAQQVSAETPVSLVRQLGATSATALVVSNMVGTGIFVTTSFLAGDLANVPSILAIWVVGALIALSGAFCYSELGVNFPSSGGEYVYQTQAYGPVFGFMTGWVSFFAGFSAPIAGAALAFATYLGYFSPALKQGQTYFKIWEFSFGAQQVAACALIIGMTLVNLFDIRVVARLQNFFTAFKIGVLLVLIIFGFASGAGNWANLSTDAVRTSSLPLMAQFFISLCFIYNCYSGWNAATYVAEEVKQPAKTLPWALAAGTLLVALLYLVLNVLFIYAIPLEQMKGNFAVGSTAAANLFGAGIGGTFAAAMALALFASVNAMIIIGPRVYYAMAKNRAFFPFAADLSPRTRTPIKAILLQCLCACVITMTPLPNLMLFVGFTLNIFAVITVTTIFVHRKRPNWQRLKIVNFLYPLFPMIFIIAGLWVTYFGLTSAPTISLTAFGLIAAGALVYYFRIKDSQLTASSTVAGD
jgi:APA family basic amino acid/polyamine antiporter